MESICERWTPHTAPVMREAFPYRDDNINGLKLAIPSITLPFYLVAALKLNLVIASHIYHYTCQVSISCLIDSMIIDWWFNPQTSDASKGPFY